MRTSFFIVLKLKYESFYKPCVPDYQVVKKGIYGLQILQKAML